MRASAPLTPVFGSATFPLPVHFRGTNPAGESKRQQSEPKTRSSRPGKRTPPPNIAAVYPAPFCPPFGYAVVFSLNALSGSGPRRRAWLASHTAGPPPSATAHPPIAQTTRRRKNRIGPFHRPRPHRTPIDTGPLCTSPKNT